MQWWRNCNRCIAGIVAAFVQFLISHFEHRFLQKAKKEEQIYSFNVWKRDEIGELIKDVSEIKIPAVTETNGDVIENAYHLIMAYFERAKPLLYKKSDPVTIRGFFNTLNIRYRQMQEIKLGYELRQDPRDLCSLSQGWIFKEIPAGA